MKKGKEKKDKEKEKEGDEIWNEIAEKKNQSLKCLYATHLSDSTVLCSLLQHDYLFMNVN